ncbi:hypothetical protein [Mucisphaera sp.]|uniref:hypothetical protein n=1 Tax=Mucisphaera sp. TaxID=2913024 RepID=UPI003D0BD0A2
MEAFDPVFLDALKSASRAVLWLVLGAMLVVLGVAGAMRRVARGGVLVESRR